MIRILLAALVAVLLSASNAFAVDAATCGYDQGAAGWYKRSDRSGPYSLDGNCNATLIGSGGGGGGTSTVTGSQEQDTRSSGTLNAASTASTLDIPVNGQSTVGLRFSGLAASGATVSYFQSNDGGTTYTPVSEVNTATGVTSLTRTTDGQVRVAVQGRTTLRLQVTTAGTGTISVAWNVSVREGLVSLASPIPPGGNTIGSIANTAFGITGPIPAGSNVIGAVTQSGGPWSVSGTVNANVTPSVGTMEQDVLGSGTLNAASTTSTLDIPLNGQSTVGLRLSGLTGSGATVSYFWTNDGTTYVAMNEVNANTGVLSLNRTTDGQIRLNGTGRRGIRLQITTAGTGTVSVAYLVSVRPSAFALDTPLPPGTNTIGVVAANLGSLNGAALAANQPTPQTAGAAATGTGLRVLGNDGAAVRDILTTTTGAMEPVTAAAGKITRTSTALTANTSTTIAAANANRIALGLQCGSGGVSVDETGGALTAAGVGNGTLFIPSGSGPYFTPPVATRTALTAYTATAQTCVVTEYLR